MIRLEGQITYNDGRVIDVVASQAEFAAWERHALRSGLPVKADQAPPITMLRYLGYAAAMRAEYPGKLQPDWPSFDEWGLGVADVTLEQPGEGAAVPPTHREAWGE